MSNAELGLRDFVDYDEFTDIRAEADLHSEGRTQRRAGAPRSTADLARRRSSEALAGAYAERAHRSEDGHAARARRSTTPAATRQGAPERRDVRTIKIRGQATPPRRRPAVPTMRYDQHPDRAAQWALFLGVFMVVVAIVTGS